MILEPRITYRNLSPTPLIERAIHREVAKLDRYARQLTGCHVVVEIPHRHHATPNPYHVRVELTLPGKQVVVGRQPTLHATAKDLGLAEQPREFDIDAPEHEVVVAIRHAFDAARRQLQDAVRVRRHDVKEHVEPATARVARLFSEQGYGFLVAPDGHEVYFHRNSVLGGGFEDLEIGSEVRFAEEPGIEGAQASTVRPLRRHQGGSSWQPSSS